MRRFNRVRRFRSLLGGRRLPYPPSDDEEDDSSRKMSPFGANLLLSSRRGVDNTVRNRETVWLTSLRTDDRLTGDAFLESENFLNGGE